MPANFFGDENPLHIKLNGLAISASPLTPATPATPLTPAEPARSSRQGNIA